MRIFFKSYGCSLNVSDTEVMAGLVLDAGFEIAKEESLADVIVVNTCVVKGPTEQKIIAYLNSITNSNVIVTGCLPQTMPERIPGFSMLGPTHITRIVEAIEETIHGNKYVLLVPEKRKRLNLPRIRRNPLVEIIPISSGCLGSCTYCIVKKARGELISYEKDEIIKHFRKSVHQGAREIWLTSQDLGSYGMDTGTSLPELLNELLIQQGNYKIRLGMMNPNHLLQISDKLLPLFKNEKLFRFMHIPLQSGDDQVLKLMDRRYNAEEFLSIVEKIRDKYPDMTIATDVICGFPQETREQFDRTIEVLRKVRPDAINISRFWERPGTPAALMEGKLEQEEIKDRSSKMKTISEFIMRERNKRWIGWKGKVIVDEIDQSGIAIARNYAYKQVILDRGIDLGEEKDVHIRFVTANDLRI